MVVFAFTIIETSLLLPINKQKADRSLQHICSPNSFSYYFIQWKKKVRGRAKIVMLGKIVLQNSSFMLFKLFIPTYKRENISNYIYDHSSSRIFQFGVKTKLSNYKTEQDGNVKKKLSRKYVMATLQA